MAICLAMLKREICYLDADSQYIIAFSRGQGWEIVSVVQGSLTSKDPLENSLRNCRRERVLQHL